MSAVHTEKWVRTLERSPHMLSDTQLLRLYAQSESDYCVPSYSPPYMNVPTSHSCLFSSIIDGTQQLTARFTTAAISMEQCGGLDTGKIEEERKSIC